MQKKELFLHTKKNYLLISRKNKSIKTVIALLDTEGTALIQSHQPCWSFTNISLVRFGKIWRSSLGIVFWYGTLVAGIWGTAVWALAFWHGYLNAGMLAWAFRRGWFGTAVCALLFWYGSLNAGLLARPFRRLHLGPFVRGCFGSAVLALVFWYGSLCAGIWGTAV